MSFKRLSVFRETAMYFFADNVLFLFSSFCARILRSTGPSSSFTFSKMAPRKKFSFLTLSPRQIETVDPPLILHDRTGAVIFLGWDWLHGFFLSLYFNTLCIQMANVFSYYQKFGKKVFFLIFVLHSHTFFSSRAPHVNSPLANWTFALCEMWGPSSGANRCLLQWTFFWGKTGKAGFCCSKFWAPLTKKIVVPMCGRTRYREGKMSSARRGGL